MRRRKLAVASRIASFLFILMWILLAIFDKHFPSVALSEIIIFSIAMVSWFFIISYHFKSASDDHPWWQSEMGRHVMSFVTVDASIFSFLGGVAIWPTLALHSWYVWLYFGTVSGMGWVMLWRISILYRPDIGFHSREVKEDD